MWSNWIYLIKLPFGNAALSETVNIKKIITKHNTDTLPNYLQITNQSHIIVTTVAKNHNKILSWKRLCNDKQLIYCHKEFKTWKYHISSQYNFLFGWSIVITAKIGKTVLLQQPFFYYKIFLLNTIFKCSLVVSAYLLYSSI